MMCFNEKLQNASKIKDSHLTILMISLISDGIQSRVLPFRNDNLSTLKDFFESDSVVHFYKQGANTPVV